MSEAKPTDAAGGASPSTDGLGVAVIVSGKILAWFSTFDDAALEWCREYHFGKWLTWRAKPPEIVPLTNQESEAVDEMANKMVAKFREAPNMKDASPTTDNIPPKK